MSYLRFIKRVPLTAIPLMAYLRCLLGEAIDRAMKI